MVLVRSVVNTFGSPRANVVEVFMVYGTEGLSSCVPLRASFADTVVPVSGDRAIPSNVAQDFRCELSLISFSAGHLCSIGLLEKMFSTSSVCYSL